MRHLFIFLLTIVAGHAPGKTLVVAGSVSQGATAASARAGSLVGKPPTFIENKGQVCDQFGHARADIQYKVAAPGLNIYIGAGQLHYQFINAAKEKGNGHELRKGDATADTLYRMDVALVGANTYATLSSDGLQAYQEHYRLSQGTGITAYSYSKITYRNIYPHIDWVLYTRNNQLEYDFVVHEGGNVADIKMAYSGATGIRRSTENAIVATTPLGSIIEQRPYSYEVGSGRSVTSATVLRNNVLTFKTGSYRGTLVIDPSLAWATYYGGMLNDIIADIATDALRALPQPALTNLQLAALSTILWRSSMEPGSCYGAPILAAPGMRAAIKPRAMPLATYL